MSTQRPTVNIDEDHWTTIEWVGQHEECCECGLKHTVTYRVHDGKLQFKAARLNRR